MKKYILLSAVALIFASCSKDGNEIATDSLVPVTIGAKTGMAEDLATRAVWGIIQTDSKGQSTIAVKFEPGESFDVYELGYSGKQKFTDSDITEYQSGNFSGLWHEEGTHWAAVLPSGAATNVEMAESYNTYYLKVPTSQTCFMTSYTDFYGTNVNTMSPDRSANIMVGAKPNHTTETCFLSPVCAYLYFATDPSITTVKVSTTTDKKPLAGSIVVRTGIEWDGWENYVNSVKTTTRTQSSDCFSITVNGAKTTRSGSEITEYVVCVIPGTYTDLKITDASGNTLAESTKTNTFKAVNLYYLGKIGD